MGSSAATGLSPEALFTESEAFPITFASFLRRHPEAWRVRRVDRFSPTDLHLAEHHVTLQGRIDPGLLERFVQLEHELELHLDPAQLKNGAALMIYVPAITHAKRLLLDFSIRNVQNHAVPMLSRFESARVTGVHLTTIVVGQQPITDADALCLHAALVALAFHDPFALDQRIGKWIADPTEGKPTTRPPARWGKRGCLDDSHLLAWVEREGEAFLPELGAPLREVVEKYLEKPDDTPQLESYVPPLAHYETVPRLFLHAIRAVLKTTVGLAPVLESGMTARSTRRSLMNHPKLLAAQVEERPLHGLAVLARLLKNSDGHALEELYADLARWTSYIPFQIELGVPFVLKFSEVTPVAGEASQLKRYERIAATFRARHFYPIPAKDADAVHVEVEVPDPVLRLGCPPRIVARIRRWHEFLPRSVEVPLPWVFGALNHPSERLVHLYSTRMRGENVKDPIVPLRGPRRVVARIRRWGEGLPGPLGVPLCWILRPVERLSDRLERLYSKRMHREDLTYDKLLPYLRLEVRFRLVRTVAAGHTLAVLASILAAGYIVWTAGDAGWTRTALDKADFRIVATVGALAITVSLWLTSIPHPRPLAFKKLEVARMLLCTSLVAIVAALAFYGVRVGLDL